MNVMTARVHHRYVLARVIFRRDRARVRGAGFFLHRQRIQVGANADNRAIAIFHHTDNAEALHIRLFVFTHPFRHLITGCFQFFRDDAGGTLLVSGKFRMRMQVFIDAEERGQLSVSNLLWGLLGECGD